MIKTSGEERQDQENKHRDDDNGYRPLYMPCLILLVTLLRLVPLLPLIYK